MRCGPTSWRYIRYADGGEELYDEAADPQEWKNLAGNPELASIKAELAKYMPKVNAPPGPKVEGAPDDVKATDGAPDG